MRKMRNLLHAIETLMILGCLLLIANSGCRDWDVEPHYNTENTWHFFYLKIKPLSAESAEISWDGYSPNPDFIIDGYRINKKIDNGETMTIGTFNIDQKTYIDTALNTMEHSYTYIISGYADSLVYGSMSKTYKFACGFDQYTDPRDGNTYNTMSDGYYCWLAENLKYLPEVYPPEDLMKDSSQYFVYGYSGYDIAEAKTHTNYQSYSVLYSSAASLNACPETDGWQLANQDEWRTLINVAGYELEAGGALKEKDTLHWKYPNTGATNAFGFTAIPGGQLDSTRAFSNISQSAYFWGVPYGTFSIFYNSPRIFISNDTINQANSIRCIRKLN